MSSVREIKKDFAERMVNVSLKAFSDRIPRDKHDEIIKELPKSTGWVLERLGESAFQVVKPPMLSQDFDEAFYFISSKGLPSVAEGEHERIFTEIAESMATHFASLSIGVSWDNEPFVKRIRLKLSNFADYLTGIGFVSDGLVHFSSMRSGEIDFPGFSQDVWGSKREGEFLFEKRNPVLLGSNERIYQEFGIYPQISTRAMGILLKQFLVEAECTKMHINPEGFDKDTVIEHWKISI